LSLNIKCFIALSKIIVKQNYLVMKRMKSLFAILAVIALTSCNPHFLSNRFDSLTADHKVIAVLPFEMRFTGFMPKEMFEEDIILIEEAESRAFQYSFYNELLRRTRIPNKALKVEVQDHGKTLALLEKNGISIRESWNMLPEELAPILGVDAVVRARVQKARIMSDLASFGIEIGRDLVNRIARIPFRVWMSGISNQNKVIVADFALFNENNGTTLWSIEFQEDADWRKPANETIAEISQRAVKRFPYRYKN